MAWWWRRLAGKLLQRGRGGDGVPRVAQGCTEAIGGVEVDGGEAELPGLLAGGDCGGGDLTGRVFLGLSNSGKARRSVASRGEEDDDHGGVLRLHERRRGVAVLVQTPASSRRGELHAQLRIKFGRGIRRCARSKARRWRGPLVLGFDYLAGIDRIRRRTLQAPVSYWSSLGASFEVGMEGKQKGARGLLIERKMVSNDGH